MARINDTRTACTIFVGKSFGKRRLEGQEKAGDNINMDFSDVGSEYGRCQDHNE
jgi:hypothetical protein